MGLHASYAESESDVQRADAQTYEKTHAALKATLSSSCGRWVSEPEMMGSLTMMETSEIMPLSGGPERSSLRRIGLPPSREALKVASVAERSSALSPPLTVGGLVSILMLLPPNHRSY
jgi:hypothetical protein